MPRFRFASAGYVARLLLALIAFSITPAHAAVTFETRVLSGQQASGIAPGINYSSFERPVFIATGQTAFLAGLTGIGLDSSNNSGIWSEAAGSIGSPGLVARAGNAAPGTAHGVNYSQFDNPVRSAAGQAAFFAILTGAGVDGTNDSGIWSETAGSIGPPRLVARTGDPAPGTAPGVNYSFLDTLVQNAAGQVAFAGSLTGLDGSNNYYSGIWSEAASSLGSPGLVALAGDPAPGTAPGVNFSGFDVPALNAAGHTAFAGVLTGTGVDGTNDSGIWSEAAGSLGSPELVARAGDAAPGTSLGVNYGSLSSPRLNAAGQIAFAGGLTGTGVDSTNDYGIWSEAGGSHGSLGLVARTGDPAPGTGVGVNYRFLGSPKLNGAGQTAFAGVLTGTDVSVTNNRGIWSETVGSLGLPGLVARSGDAAPGTTFGVNFFGFDSPAINDAGQIAFEASLMGDGIDGTNDYGIWAADLDGMITLIIREGDLLDVNDDPIIEDFRTVYSVNSSFNDIGQLAFAASFTDGSSGIFVSTIADIVLGDYNGNGIVDAADYTVWADDFGSMANLAADGNGNGTIDAADYTVWADNFGQSESSPQNAIIPEPTTMSLVMVGLAWGLKRRRV